MTISVLIVDADEEYRELTAKTLDNTGQYKSIAAQSARVALSLQSEAKPQIAIVDTDLPDMDGVEFIRHLRQLDKHLLIIAVVEDEEVQSPLLEPLDVRSILEKPFYLPELPEIIKSAVRGTPRKAAPVPKMEAAPTKDDMQIEPTTRGWFVDADQTCDFLTRLFNEHSARALMIMQGRSPWARSSQISDGDAQLIAKLLLENLPEGSPLESIVRYIRLRDLDGDLLLYTTPIEDEFVLVLLYDSEKAFSLARRQAKYLRELILTLDPSELPLPEITPRDEAAAVPSTQAGDSTLPDDWIPQTPASLQDFPQLSEMEIPPTDPSSTKVEGTPSAELPPLPTDWFPKRPMPSANFPFLAPEEVDHASLPEGPAASEMVERLRQPDSSAAPEEMESASHPEDLTAPDEVDHASSLEDTAAPDDVGNAVQPESQAGPVEVGSTEQPESSAVSQVHYEARFHLPFSAVLIPQNPAHQLDNVLADEVEVWLKDISLAWGWRANNIQISPHYLHLTVYLSPEVAPSDAVQRVSLALSKRILAANPQYSEDPTTGQFWAKHYLLIAGEGIEGDRINTFIQAVRQDPGTSPLADN